MFVSLHAHTTTEIEAFQKTKLMRKSTSTRSATGEEIWKASAPNANTVENLSACSPPLSLLTFTYCAENWRDLLAHHRDEDEQGCP